MKARMDLVTIFGIAFGYLEAMVVVYLRRILPPLPWEVMSVAEFSNLLRSHGVLFLEQTREASTIVILIAIALLIGKKRSEKWAIFLWAFAIWDIFYYIWLKVLIGWPPSLVTIDCLFLIPGPRFAPVFVPLVVSLVMMGVAIFLLRKAKKS
ncbi:MAG TPA: hypothetical protein ENH97_00630 [bacterium]|nr:hypothetical protein [bacterium]